MKQLKLDGVFILRLFADKRFDVATVGLIAALATTFVPAWAPHEAIIMILITSIAALLIHQFTVTEVQHAGDTPPTDLMSAFLAEIPALMEAIQEATKASNAATTATVVNTAATQANTTATASSVAKLADGVQG